MQDGSGTTWLNSVKPAACCAVIAGHCAARVFARRHQTFGELTSQNLEDGNPMDSWLRSGGAPVRLSLRRHLSRS